MLFWNDNLCCPSAEDEAALLEIKCILAVLCDDDKHFEFLVMHDRHILST